MHPNGDDLNLKWIPKLSGMQFDGGHLVVGHFSGHENTWERIVRDLF